MKVENPLIYLLTDGSLTNLNCFSKLPQLVDLTEVAVKSEIPLIQIREKNLSARFLFELASTLVKITQNSSTKILVNDRADIALASGADGVHLTSNSIPTKIIRQNFPPDFIVGVSTHTPEKALEAKNAGADFVVFSPIFYTPNKETPQGVNKLAEVVKLCDSFPVIALGGINRENLAETLSAGASGIAAIRLFNEADKLPEIVEEIRNKYYD